MADNIEIIEQSFDSGFRGEYKGYHIDERLITQPNSISPVVLKMKDLQSQCKLINTSRLGLEIFNSLVYLNKHIEYIFQMYYRTFKPSQIIDGVSLSEINIQKELIIHIMKRIIDDLIMVLYLRLGFDDFQNQDKIVIDSLGALVDNNAKVALAIKDKLNFKKYGKILKTINNLHNAYKHSCFNFYFHDEYATECVLMSAFHAKYNKFDTVYYYRHNLMHIVIGFNDFLLEFFDIEATKRHHDLVKHSYFNSCLAQ